MQERRGQECRGDGGLLANALDAAHANLKILQGGLRGLRDRLGGTMPEPNERNPGKDCEVSRPHALVHRAAQIVSDTQKLVEVLKQLNELV